MAKGSMMSMVVGGMLAIGLAAAPAALRAQGNGTVLKPADMEKLMPASVYYCGQKAPTQLRNSGGVKFSDGHYILAAMVDTSGYSSGIVAKYQANFVVEVPIHVGGKTLGAGVYGIGFVANDKFLVTDVGAHDVLTVDSATDNDLKRPMPLQVVADPTGRFRLYAGRKYVVLSR